MNAPATHEIVFTRNATESINLVAYSWARANLKTGDVVVLSHMEHHANVVPWHILAAERGIELRWIPMTPDFRLDLSGLDALLDGARLLAISAMSNVLGTINDIRPLADAAHARGALILVDACQFVPHVATDVQAWDADFIAFSSHKILGPTGIGVLWGRTELLEAMPPFLGGGEMIRDVRVDGFTSNDLPWKFEAGTPAIVEAVGFGAALDYISALGMDAVRAHERLVTRYALDSLARPLRRQPHDLRADRHRRAGRCGVVPVRRGPRPRREPGPRRRRGLRAGRSPLRQALDAPARRPGHDTSVVLRLQRRGRRRRARRGVGKGPEVLRGLGSQQMAGLEDLYREIILDHYRSPRNRGELPVPPAHKVEGFNPLCGDEVVLYLDVDPATDTVRDVKIAGQGCSISQASTSMMSAAVKGKSVEEVHRLIRAFKALMSIHESKLEGDGGDGSDLAADLAGVKLGDLEALQGVVKFPVRIKCATLAWNTLQQALDETSQSQT